MAEIPLLVLQKEAQTKRLLELALKQRKIHRRVIRKFSKVNTTIGRKRSILYRLKESGPRLKPEKRSVLIEELDDIIKGQIDDIDYGLASETFDSENGKKIMDIIALEIATEKGIFKSNKFTAEALRIHISKINHDSQHLFQSRDLLDAFKEEYAKSLEDTEITQQQAEEERQVLSEDELIKGILERLKAILLEQKNALSSEEQFGRIFLIITGLLPQELKLYPVLFNYFKIKKSLCKKIAAGSKEKEGNAKSEEKFFTKLRSYRRKAIAGAAIIIPLWFGPINSAINNISSWFEPSYKNYPTNVGPNAIGNQKKIQDFIKKEKGKRGLGDSLMRAAGLEDSNWQKSLEALTVEDKEKYLKGLKKGQQFLEKKGKSTETFVLVRILKALSVLSLRQWGFLAIIYFIARFSPIGVVIRLFEAGLVLTGKTLSFPLRLLLKELIIGLRLLGKDVFNLGPFLLYRTKNIRFNRREARELLKISTEQWAAIIKAGLKAESKKTPFTKKGKSPAVMRSSN